jgi:hypothetical protein
MLQMINLLYFYRVQGFDGTDPAVCWQYDDTDTAAKPGRGFVRLTDRKGYRYLYPFEEKTVLD